MRKEENLETKTCICTSINGVETIRNKDQYNGRFVSIKRTGKNDFANHNDSNNIAKLIGAVVIGIGIGIIKLYKYIKTNNENQQDKPADIKMSGELHHNNPVKVNCLSYNSIKNGNKIAA